MQCCLHVLFTNGFDNVSCEGSGDHTSWLIQNREKFPPVLSMHSCHFLLLLHKHLFKENNETEVEPKLNRPYRYKWSNPSNVYGMKSC